MERDSQTVKALEEQASVVLGKDWFRNGLDRNLIDNLGKYRKYDGGSVRDLMRVLRNKVGCFHLPKTAVDASDFDRNIIFKICPTTFAGL